MSLSYVKDWSILCNIYAMIVSLRAVSSNVCALFFPLLGACWGQLTNGGFMGGLQVQREQCFVVVSADSYCLLFSHKKTNIDKYRFSLRLVALPFEPRSQDRSLGFPFFFPFTWINAVGHFEIEVNPSLMYLPYNEKRIIRKRGNL